MWSQRLDDCLLWSDWVVLRPRKSRAKWMNGCHPGKWRKHNEFFLSSRHADDEFHSFSFDVIFRERLVVCKRTQQNDRILSRPLMVFGVQLGLRKQAISTSTSFLSLKRQRYRTLDYRNTASLRNKLDDFFNGSVCFADTFPVLFLMR